jgi:hypothetical protein
MRVADRYELARDLRKRYAAASRAERRAILDAFCVATVYNRKSAGLCCEASRANVPRGAGGRIPATTSTGSELRECSTRATYFSGNLTRPCAVFGEEFSTLRENALVSRVNRRMHIRMVRF